MSYLDELDAWNQQIDQTRDLEADDRDANVKSIESVPHYWLSGLPRLEAIWAAQAGEECYAYRAAGHPWTDVKEQVWNIWYRGNRYETRTWEQEIAPRVTERRRKREMEQWGERYRWQLRTFGRIL